MNIHVDVVPVLAELEGPVVTLPAVEVERPIEWVINIII